MVRRSGPESLPHASAGRNGGLSGSTGTLHRGGRVPAGCRSCGDGGSYRGAGHTATGRRLTVRAPAICEGTATRRERQRCQYRSRPPAFCGHDLTSPCTCRGTRVTTGRPPRTGRNGIAAPPERVKISPQRPLSAGLRCRGTTRTIPALTRASVRGTGYDREESIVGGAFGRPGVCAEPSRMQKSEMLRGVEQIVQPTCPGRNKVPHAEIRDAERR